MKILGSINKVIRSTHFERPRGVVIPRTVVEIPSSPKGGVMELLSPQRAAQTKLIGMGTGGSKAEDTCAGPRPGIRSEYF